MRNYWKSLVYYFIQGLIFVVPTFTTLYILYFLFVVIDDLLPWKIFPGSGILILFVFVTILGLLANTFIAKPIKSSFFRLLDRAPLVKTLYTALTDMINAVLGNKKKFSNPVLVKLSKESNLLRIGFITQEDLSNLGIDKNLVSVYLPHSYNFSGNLFIVEKENITPLNIKASEAMKFIVSGGVAEVIGKADGTE